MGLYKSTNQQGQPLNTAFAEDTGQFVDVLMGQRDAGLLSLLPPLAAPGAPAVSLAAGGVTGTGYQWAVYWITGIIDGTGAAHVTGRTAYGTLTAGQALASQQAIVSVSGLTVPTGAIGWGVARNKSGGGSWYTVPGSEQFLTTAGTMPASFVDNTADASLVTAAPTTNSTGTYLKLPVGIYLDFAGTAAPPNTGLLLCDGSAISRTTYAALFALIGTSFGAGDGSTTFNLPDYRGRVMVYIGMNASVSSLNLNDGQPAVNRRPQHRTTNSLSVAPSSGFVSLRIETAGGGTIRALQAGLSSGAWDVRTDGVNSDSHSHSLSGSIGTNNGNDALDTPSYIVGGTRLIQS